MATTSTRMGAMIGFSDISDNDNRDSSEVSSWRRKRPRIEEMDPFLPAGLNMYQMPGTSGPMLVHPFGLMLAHPFEPMLAHPFGAIPCPVCPTFFCPIHPCGGPIPRVPNSRVVRVRGLPFDHKASDRYKFFGGRHDVILKNNRRFTRQPPIHGP